MIKALSVPKTGVKTESGSRSQKLAKSYRLLTQKDFQFRPFSKFRTVHFQFIYTSCGRGRVGISISKKVLKTAVARNRIKRLIREVFRKNRRRQMKVDFNVIGLPALTKDWQLLMFQNMEEEFGSFIKKAGDQGVSDCPGILKGNDEN